MREVNPKETSRALAFESWIKAPQPMVTIIKKFNIKHLVKVSKKKDLKLNMLLCYCIGRAAENIEEFHLLPVGDKLYFSGKLAINVIVKTQDGSIHFCDIPFKKNLSDFNKEYLERTRKVFIDNEDCDLKDYIVIGTSCITNVYVDGIVNMYSGIFNNPFLAWGKYKKKKNKVLLPISFQFHHSQMDGEQAGEFLSNLKKEIKNL